MTAKTMKVTIPRILGIYEVPFDEGTWDGSLAPRFTLPQVRQIAEESAQSFFRVAEEVDRVHVDGDIVSIETIYATREICDPEPDGLYSLGSYEWKWEFSTDECPSCGNTIAECTNGDITAHWTRHFTKILAFTCSTPCADAYEAWREL